LVLASSSPSLSGSPDRVSPLSQPGTLARYPAGYPPRSAGELINRTGFPLPFGDRHSLLGHPLPAGELGPPHGRLTGQAAGPRRGFRVPRARAAIGEGALYTPGTMVLIPTDGDSRPASAASQRPVPAPRNLPIGAGVRITRHQRGFKQFARPIFPSLWPPGWIKRPLGSPPGSAPRRPRAGQRTPRWGQVIKHGPGTIRSTHIVDLQSGSSLNACDIASHVAKGIVPFEKCG
jgi:hypothetical protein